MLSGILLKTLLGHATRQLFPASQKKTFGKPFQDEKCHLRFHH